MATYWEKLRDPRWQRKRLEIMEQAGFACQMCEAEDKTLNVHHKIYRKGANPWDYANHELRCLCEDCHEIEHGWRRLLDEAIAEIEPGRIEELVGYAQGIVATDIVFTDMEKESFNRCWKMLSHEQAFGFMCRMLGADWKKAEQLIDNGGVVSEVDVFRLQTERFSVENS